MKTCKAVLLLVSFLIIASANASVLSCQNAGATSCITPTSNQRLKKPAHYTGLEIEHAQLSCNLISRAHQLLKNLTGYLPGTSQKPGTSSCQSSRPVFATRQPFDNIHLSHNYPSHNFW
jgi:hypothetical protein